MVNPFDGRHICELVMHESPLMGKGRKLSICDQDSIVCINFLEHSYDGKDIVEMGYSGHERD